MTMNKHNDEMSGFTELLVMFIWFHLKNETDGFSVISIIFVRRIRVAAIIAS